MSRTGAIGLIIAAAALALPLVSPAAAELEIHYRKQQSSAPSGQQTPHVSPACPPGELVASGGARPDGSGMVINSTYPLESLRRWRVYYDNHEKEADVTTFAICVNREPAVRTKFATGPGRHFLAPRCALPPMEPTGGGLFASGGFGTTYLEEQGAESSKDHLPRGNWNTTVRGPQLTDSVTVTAYSVCIPTSTPRYPAEFGSDQQGPGWGRTTSRCRRSERVVGGGGFLYTSLPSSPPAYIVGSYPVDAGFDSDRAPDNGWRTYMEWDSSTPLSTVLAFAVCVST